MEDECVDGRERRGEVGAVRGEGCVRRGREGEGVWRLGVRGEVERYGGGVGEGEERCGCWETHIVCVF